MKKLKCIVSPFLCFSLLFTGCSQPIRYNGETKEELNYIYEQKERAVLARDLSIKTYDSLEKKCFNKLKESRISFANSCTSKLKGLKEQISYYETVIQENNNIIQKIEMNREEILMQRAKRDRYKSNERWSLAKKTAGWTLLIASFIALGSQVKTQKDIQ